MSIKMKELPKSERPYEKLELYGEKTLSNAELLAIIIKTGTKDETSVELAQRILKLNDTDTEDLSYLQALSIEELMQIKGIGKVKAIQLKAICELAKRMSSPINILKIKIKSGQDVANMFMEELRYEKREIVKIIILNTKNNIIKIEDVAVGGVDFVNVSPKDILTEVIKVNAPKMIIIHNHPSGDPTPSRADIEITNRIYACCELFQIKLLDHIVIGDGKFESIFSKKGLWN